MAARRLTTVAIGALGLAVGLLAACGSSGDPTGSAAPPANETSGQSSAASGHGQSGGNNQAGGRVHDLACSVLTKKDAATILGVQSASLTPTQTSETCSYAADSGDFQTVGLSLFGPPASTTLISVYRSQYDDLAPYSGLGDSALSGTDGRLVVAVKGTVGCVALRAGDPPADTVGSTQKLAALCTDLFAAS